MMKLMMIYTVLFLNVILTACSNLNSDFECRMKPGIRCESLGQINERVDRGEIGKSSIVNLNHSTVSNKNLNASDIHNKQLNISGDEPLRYNETAMRVWVAPYEDTAGNYHQESDIYTIVKPGHWIGNPPKELMNEEG